jgi:hypothetical protein
MNKIVILPYFPYNLKMKLRLEVLFKKFHPKMNLTTLFFTKSYLLTTIKPFAGLENRSLTKSQKTFKGRNPYTMGKFQYYLHGSGLLGSEKQWL